MNKNNNLCNNCGKHGHTFSQCKLPITSYGLIVFRPSSEGLQYLMIRRKNSFGFSDFMKGKYSPYNIDQIQGFINEMTQHEKTLLSTFQFDDLWKIMWGDYYRDGQFKNEENLSSKKFELIKNGVILNFNNKDKDNTCDTDVNNFDFNNIVLNEQKTTLYDLINSSNTQWDETEWEFPKGKRGFQEKDLECAIREFEEETGCSRNKINIIENLVPFEEMFIGSNHKSYKYKYFLAYYNDNENKSKEIDTFQKSEASKLEWKTLDECLKSIRPYNLEKIHLINNINKVLQEYRLYC